METKRLFRAKGMHCASCETLIERSVEKLDGIEGVSADYATETVYVIFDSEKISVEDIERVIGDKGYDCCLCDDGHSGIQPKVGGFVFGAIGLLVLGYFIFRFVGSIGVPEISQNMGYGLLFVMGLLTGFHCVSMCGGFVVSYAAKNAQMGGKSHKSHLLYGLGKTVSYTVMGAAFGLLGSIIVFTPVMRGIAGVAAGVFLVVFGLNMLNLVPWLRKVRIKTPAFVGRFVSRESGRHRSPLVIGLLNGLMIACGPLQAIYIMAAGTGSALEGARLLLIFALGTLPVMLGFGFFTSFISKKATHKILKASGVVVIILGLIMVNRGLALTGAGFDYASLTSSVSVDSLAGDAVANIEGGYQVIHMEVTGNGWEPNKFILREGIPVKWVIDGKEINGCNNAIQVPKLGLNFGIRQGEQTVEFTPVGEGVISWSCWMGMIPGTFIVKEDIDLNDAQAVQDELSSVPDPVGESCGCGGAR